MLYTRNKPHKRKPNWKNISLTALCAVVLIISATLLVKSIPGLSSPSKPVNSPSASAAATPENEPSAQPTATVAPTETPEATAEPEATPEPQRGSGVQSITFGAIGDIIMHEHELMAAKNGNTYDFTNFFSRIQPYISWQDVVIGNLETTIAENGFDAKTSPGQLLTGLKDAGADVLTLANEHILDHDIAGAQYTVKAVADAGLTSVGAYTSGADYIQPMILTKDDLRIAVLNYTESTEQNPDGAADTVKYLTQTAFDNDMNQVLADPVGVDFIIVYVHWGQEDSADLTDSQKAWAQTFADAGVDVVLGSHAHLPQQLMYVQGKDGNKTLVAYGLGNFLSGARKDGKDAGVIVNFTLTKDFDNDVKSIAEVTYTPTWVLKYSAQGKYSFEVMSAVEYSQKHYQNMSVSDNERIVKVADEIKAALGTGAGTLDENIRTMTDGVSTIVSAD